MAESSTPPTILLIQLLPHRPTMNRLSADQEKLFQLSALCREAIQAQHHRAARQGFGLDDYTEGRIVGAANLARKLMRVLSGGQAQAAGARVRPRRPTGR